MRPQRVFLSCSLPENCGGAMIFEGLADELAGSGLTVFRTSSAEELSAEWQRDQEIELARCADDPGVAAVVLFGSDVGAHWSAVQALIARGKPIVLLGHEPDRRLDELPCDYVGVNDFTAARRVVMHLISLGHRNIAHITNEQDSASVRDRRLGYRRALERAGLPVREELIVDHGADSLGRIEFSQEALANLLDLPDPPTAVFAVHDWAALNVMMTAHLAGIRVPKDLAVAGFDAIDRFWFGTPMLTSAAQPFGEMGRQAGILVLDRLDRSAPRVGRYVYVEAPLRVHGSTKAAPKDSASTLFQREGFWRAMLVKHHIRNRLEMACSLPELAKVAGVSARTLLSDFRNQQEGSPADCMAEERLLRVRQELQQARQGTTVSEAVYHWGGTHLGRFAVQYRKRFGETPSATLRSALEADRPRQGGHSPA